MKFRWNIAEIQSIGIVSIPVLAFPPFLQEAHQNRSRQNDYLGGAGHKHEKRNKTILKSFGSNSQPRGKETPDSVGHCWHISICLCMMLLQWRGMTMLNLFCLKSWWTYSSLSSQFLTTWLEPQIFSNNRVIADNRMHVAECTARSC